jgi:hypothetical protein
MLFKYFFESQILDEAAESTIHGQIVEGLFAISLAVYIAHGKKSVEDFMSEVESVRNRLKAVGKDYKAIVDNDITNNMHIHKLIGSTPDSNDKIMVKVNLEGFAGDRQLKKVFGEGSKLPKNVTPFLKNITNRISSDPMKAEVSLKSLQKINDFIEEVLTNNEPDKVAFTVAAVGASGGKSDVTIFIDAETNEPVPQKITQPIGFSLKTKSDFTRGTTNIHNGGLFQVLFQLAKDFKLPLVNGLADYPFPPKIDRWRDHYMNQGIDPNPLSQDENNLLYYIRKAAEPLDKYQSRKSDIKQWKKEDPERYMEFAAEFEKLRRDSAVDAFKLFLTEFESQISKMEGSDELTKMILDFLELSIFGMEKADLVSIGHEDIEELTHQDYSELKNNIDVDYKQSQGHESPIPNMIFYDKKTGLPLLTLQTRISENSKDFTRMKVEMMASLGDYFKKIGSTK